MNTFMSGTYTPERFLEKLGGKWKWRKKFDVVFMGTCSTGYGRGYIGTLRHDEYHHLHINPNFFKQEMKKKKPKRALLLSECCGNYGQEHVDELRRLYPKTEWVAPGPIRDYCENARVDFVIEDLVAFGIIERKE